jgi:hypothetical protein
MPVQLQLSLLCLSARLRFAPLLPEAREQAAVDVAGNCSGGELFTEDDFHAAQALPQAPAHVDPARLVRAWLEYELPARLSIVVHYSLVGVADIGTLLRQPVRAPLPGRASETRGGVRFLTY